MYRATVIECSKEIDPILLYNMTNGGDYVNLFDLTAKGAITLDIDFTVKLHVNNDTAKNPEYDKYVFVDKGGTCYSSGSERLYEAVKDIQKTFDDIGHPYLIEVFRRPSKNYAEKDFLSCKVVSPPVEQ